MQVSELDRAEFPHSYVRKRRMTCGNRMICCGNAPIVRNFRTIDCGISAPSTAECAWYNADPCAHDKRRKLRTICCGNAQIVRKFRTIDGGISAPYTAESARYDADPCAHDKRRKMRTIC